MEQRAAGGGGSAGEDLQGNKWSKPVSLHQAISQAPVLIQLEEGHRGESVDLSLSKGDTMALEGLTEVRGRRVVMAHYAGGGPEDRALVTLPYDNLPELDVRIVQDPGGKAYANFLACHFSSCNWADGHQGELLKKMGDHNYINIKTIRSMSLRSPTSSTDKENWAIPGQRGHRRPPPPPPDTQAATPTSPGGRMGKGGNSQQDSPPPRPHRAAPCAAVAGTDHPTQSLPRVPPRPPRRSVDRPSLGEQEGNGEGKGEVSAATPSLAEVFSRGQGRVDEEDQPCQAHLKPPPRPPRRSADPPFPSLSELHVEEGEEEEEGGEVFCLPPLADMFSPTVYPNDPYTVRSQTNVLLPERASGGKGTSQPDVLLPERASGGKEKKKGSPLDRMKKLLVKKVYATSKALHLSSNDQNPQPTTTIPANTNDGLGNDDNDDDDSDGDSDYTEIDEQWMVPTFDKTDSGRKTSDRKQDRSKPERPKEDKTKQKKAEKTKATAVAAVVKPTLHVPPHRVGGGGSGGGGGRVPLTSHSSPTSLTPKPAAAKDSKQHPMFVPFGTSPVDEDLYEIADDESPETVTAPLAGMKCSELCSRLRQCGMSQLADICRDKMIDGAFFCELSDDTLKKPPFSLCDFDVDAKLKMVKSGWVPA